MSVGIVKTGTGAATEGVSGEQAATTGAANPRELAAQLRLHVALADAMAPVFANAVVRIQEDSRPSTAAITRSSGRSIPAGEALRLGLTPETPAMDKAQLRDHFAMLQRVTDLFQHV